MGRVWWDYFCGVAFDKLTVLLCVMCCVCDVVFVHVYVYVYMYVYMFMVTCGNSCCC